MPITTKAPRGTNKIVAAFISELDAIPASSANEVAKAAIAKIKAHVAERAAANKAAAKAAKGAAPKGHASKARTAAPKAARRPYTRRAKAIPAQSTIAGSEIGALN